MTTTDEPEALYPCDDCGTMRTKAQGGTTFTVCDTCWDRLHSKVATDIGNEYDLTVIRAQLDEAWVERDQLRAEAERLKAEIYRAWALLKDERDDEAYDVLRKLVQP